MQENDTAKLTPTVLATIYSIELVQNNNLESVIKIFKSDCPPS